MIRKPTLILLAILALLVGLTFYLQKSPAAQVDSDSATVTPSQTPRPSVLEGWQSTSIVFIQLSSSDGSGFDLVPSDKAEDEWILGPEDGGPVSLGTIERIRSEIVSLKVVAGLEDNYTLAAFGLEEPDRVITIRSSDGKQAAIRIGSQTPTGSGYYLQVNDQAPVIVSKASLDSLFELLEKDSLLEVPDESTSTPGP